MTEIDQLLSSNGIRKAAIIDDAFDEAPRADDIDADSWTVFFDDIAEYEQKLREIYPDYTTTKREDLESSDKFVSALWKNRNLLPSEIWNTLFEEHEKKNSEERNYLERLVASLKRFGLECRTFGREFTNGARDADVVFIDLFLGFQQSDSDMEQAIKGIRTLVQGRESTPPLIVLMSRSTRLAEKRNEFRDSAGLLGSAFRVVSKSDILKQGKLESMLTRLANHYEDAKRVASFVHAWSIGLDAAKNHFIQILRRLDLPDLAQIQTLLLDFEGQKLGEYLLDVADRVLQHEIEAEPGTIAAAKELNKIELRDYPAPHLTGSPDLQDLVYRMVFQHTERLRLSSHEGSTQLQFGDLLRCKDRKSGDTTNQVFLVMMPACDLVRCDGTENVLMLPGVLKPLAARDWSYGATMTKTPIFKSPDGSRYWITWNLKGRQTIPLKRLHEQLHDDKSYERLGRLREPYAIEIQQKLLTDMGRIGQPANPPATFPVSLSFYVVSPEVTALSVAVDGLDTAVCFVGRGADGKRVDHLVLSETTCDELKSVIQNYSSDNVHKAARESLAAMKTDLDFLDRFEKGLIRVPQKDGNWQLEKGKDNQIYLHVVRNEGIGDGHDVRGNHRNAPFIMKVIDFIPLQEE